MMKRKALLLAVILVFTCIGVGAQAAGPVQLGTAASFGLLAGSKVTNDAVPATGTVINGNVGVWAGTSVTGFGLGEGTINGTKYLAGTVAGQAQSDLTTAYNAAKGAASTGSLLGTIGTLSLGPGVYTFASDLPVALLTGALTLQGTGNANEQWIFQIPYALTTNPGSSVTLIDATGCQVFWQVGSSATIADSVFAGNIMADQSVSLGGGTLYGRALARIGAVTISKAETVYAGPCSQAAVPEPMSIMLGIMGLGSIAGFKRLRRK